ncbi:SDR family oxidoreductase [Kibdelosporangium phytohabitans]|uniref:Short-chain dehydrogenase n=1 Tax=Kibdelosporangium phytohabitans TaxID=860235 RepID=A0A0N9IDG6_9PSEU|nr:SDR family oxidoreductase [Kibdelosporangium phytohabitans]ALG12786.1 short-chain dehydrogenase [Kibdelosporangium phytohabitans]MBE1464464.1 7-alpha-hydroxysteroid dehydrogenase [Kibdelosporangium phytohabitans]
MVLDRFRVDGLVGVVTGAGRGIGAATAVALAEAGADVVISSRTADQLKAVAERVEAAGRRALAVEADLNDLDAVAHLATAAKDEFGRLDIVVNNVGGSMPAPFTHTTPDALKDAFHFNVATAHALNIAAVPLMLESGGGSIVNISSAMARLSGRGFLAYGTAKAALSHYTRLAATDLAPKVRVNAICVGSVATSALDIVLRDEEIKSKMEQATPLGVIGEPEDIASAVLYLVSAAGKFVTGKVLEVDGGTERPTLDLGLEDL